MYIQRIAPPYPLCRRAAMLPQRPVRKILSSIAAITATRNSQSNETGWLRSAVPVVCAGVLPGLLLLCRCFGFRLERRGRDNPYRNANYNIWNSFGRITFNKLQHSIFDAAMKLRSLACLGVLWVTHVAAFYMPPPITAWRGASMAVTSAAGLIPPSPDELKAKAAAIREELKELEANASATNRPNADLVKPLPVRGRAGGGQTLTHTSHRFQYPCCNQCSRFSTEGIYRCRCSGDSC